MQLYLYSKNEIVWNQPLSYFRHKKEYEKGQFLPVHRRIRSTGRGLRRICG